MGILTAFNLCFGLIYKYKPLDRHCQINLNEGLTGELMEILHYYQPFA